VALVSNHPGKAASGRLRAKPSMKQRVLPAISGVNQKVGSTVGINARSRIATIEFSNLTRGSSGGRSS
jgi:hypothetical protein